MKKTVIFVSTILLFAGLTFGQTQQAQVKAKPATKTEAATPAKDSKGCDKTCTHKGKGCDHQKAGCCAKKGTEGTKEVKPTTPEKK